MSKMNNFLSGMSADNGLHDYAHASRVFVQGGTYRLHPKYGFNFFVRFILNPNYPNGDQFSDDDRREFGVLVKNIDLPKVSFDTKVMNAYNRVNLVQTKAKYDPINIKFHDDGDNIVRNFFNYYFSFHYRDTDYDDASYQAAHKYEERKTDMWGYTPGQVSDTKSDIRVTNHHQLITQIKIYSFFQKNFTEHTLHNPILSNFRHGSHSHEGNNLMEAEMTVMYETVTFATGQITGTDFDDLLILYDTKPSALNPNVNTPGVSNNELVIGSDGTPVPASPQVIYDRGGQQQPGGYTMSTGRYPYPVKYSTSPAIPQNNTSVLGRIGIGLGNQILQNVIRGRKPFGKLNVPTVTNLLVSAGQFAGGEIGSKMIAAGGLLRAGAAISRGGIGPGRLGTAVVAIQAASQLFGIKSQGPLPGIFGRNVTIGNRPVSRPPYGSYVPTQYNPSVPFPGNPYIPTGPANSLGAIQGSIPSSRALGPQSTQTPPNLGDSYVAEDTGRLYTYTGNEFDTKNEFGFQEGAQVAAVEDNNTIAMQQRQGVFDAAGFEDGLPVMNDSFNLIAEGDSSSPSEFGDFFA